MQEKHHALREYYNKNKSSMSYDVRMAHEFMLNLLAQVDDAEQLEDVEIRQQTASNMGLSDAEFQSRLEFAFKTMLTQNGRQDAINKHLRTIAQSQENIIGYQKIIIEANEAKQKIKMHEAIIRRESKALHALSDTSNLSFNDLITLVNDFMDTPQT